MRWSIAIKPACAIGRAIRIGDHKVYAIQYQGRARLDADWPVKICNDLKS